MPFARSFHTAACHFAVLPFGHYPRKMASGRGLPAGLTAWDGVPSERTTNAEIALRRKRQRVEPQRLSRSVGVGTERRAGTPLSKPTRSGAPSQSWLRLEKWEGVRGRVLT